MLLPILSVWGSIMPALNIAARLGRHTEKMMIYVSQGREDDSIKGFLKLNKSMLQKCVNVQRGGKITAFILQYICGISMNLTFCMFSLKSPALPSCLHRPPSLCLCSWNRTSCIFPPCFLCIQSCVVLIGPATYPSLLFVAAAVLKQVLVAIWPASMLLDGIALLCDTGKEREIKCCKETHRLRCSVRR